MKTQPAVSVVIPSHGRPHLLPRAIESVRAQTMTDWELLVVDDNELESPETEATKQVVEGFGDVRIAHVSNGGNKGAQAARNLGVSESWGELVAFLDDDDTWQPEKLEAQLELLQTSDPSVGFVGCAWAVVADLDDPPTRIARPTVDGDVHEHLELNRIGPLSVVLARRSALQRIGGFDPRFTHRQDLDLYLRLSRIAHFAWVDRHLVNHLDHAERKSRRPDGALRAHLVFHERWQLYIESSPRRRSCFWEKVGELQLQCGERSAAARSFARAVSSAPLRVRPWAKLATTPLGSSGFDGARRLWRALRG